MASTTTTPQAGDPAPTRPQNKQAPARRDVTTTLNYYRDAADGSSPTPVYVGKNTVINERPTIPSPRTIHDIANHDSDFQLDTHGFQLVHHRSSETSFDDEARIRKVYYAECAELYKRITGAAEAHIFQHSVRRGPTHWHSLGAGNAAQKGPLHRVHVDQSYAGAELVLRKYLPERADAVLSSGQRYQIVNLWRPIATVYKDPLAVAAAHSIAEGDLVEAKVVYVDEGGPLNRNETWAVLPGEGHEWFYKNEQGPGEVLFIKCFDSWVGEGVARRVPHSAFRDPEREGEGFADRQSIEVRGLLIHDA